MDNNYTVLMITWMEWISIYLARSVLPPVLPVLSAELGLTHTQAGLLETAYLIGYIISKLPAGAARAVIVLEVKQALKAGKDVKYCSLCGKEATWIEQYQRWYCYSCQRYLDS